MPQPTEPKVIKHFVSVSEMARMVGFSRAQFYRHLEDGVFVKPIYHKTRPLFTKAMQERNLEIKATCLGNNGEPILFYDPRKKD